MLQKLYDLRFAMKLCFAQKRLQLVLPLKIICPKAFPQKYPHPYQFLTFLTTLFCRCDERDGAFDYPCNNVVPGPIPSRMSRCVRFVRSFAACENSKFRRPREHPMNITHYIDGSMIYGSTDRELELLREGKSK